MFRANFALQLCHLLNKELATICFDTPLGFAEKSQRLRDAKQIVMLGSVHRAPSACSPFQFT